MQELYKLGLKNKLNGAILILTLAPFLLTSCTSLNKSRVYAGLGGAIAGAGVGVATGEVIGERNGYQKHSNTLAGGVVGAATGAIFGVILANFFWNEDPENRKLNQMIIKDSERKTSEAINDLPSTSSIVEAREKALVEALKSKDIKTKVYDVEPEPLPDELKGEVQKQKYIQYNIPGKVVTLPDGRTVKFNSSTATEHFYEDQKN